MSAPVLKFEGVTRRFGRRVAIDGLDLSVEPGTVLGLVGRNGSGKTTTLRLAHGVLFPDVGSVRTLGLDPVRDGLAVRRRVSLLSEESALYPWMTVGRIVELAAALHPSWDATQAASLMKRLDLDPGARIRTLSRGTQAKVALLLAVSCRPELLLLDDPTAGLDPLVRREILQGVLEAVSEEGGAVVYASHLVADIERVCDRIAFLDDGRLRFAGSLEALKAATKRARAVFDGPAPVDPELPGRIDHESDGRVLTVIAQVDNGELAASLRGLGARQIEVEPLPLEEILIAFLKQPSSAGEVPHV